MASRLLPRALRSRAIRAFSTAPSRQKITFPNIIEKNNKISVRFPGEAGDFIRFDPLYLRDSCPCPKCVDPSTRQKLFATSDLSYELAAKQLKVRAKAGGEDVLEVLWEDEHVSRFPESLLKSWTTREKRVSRRFNDIPRVEWDRDTYEREHIRLTYAEYMEDEKALWRAVRGLETHGLVFVDEVPEDENSVVRLAERIGNLKRTFYGDTWDVRSVVDAKNIAYTSQYLGLHMDLLYFESPPGIQLLHSLRNRATGGNSLFSDALVAASTLLASFPDDVRSNAALSFLSSFPIPFHYINDSYHYYYSRPLFVLDRSGSKKIDHINWAPPFQAPFEEMMGSGDSGRFRQWVGLVKKFAKELEREENVFETRLEEGNCVLFQNRRVVHGRREFDPMSGERWFKGAYVDGDAFRSKLRVLAEKYEKRYD